MANTTIEILMPGGISGALLKLFDKGVDTLLNTGGDALTERTNAKGCYTATVTEALAGTKRVVVTLSDGTTAVWLGQVTMLDDTATYTAMDEDAGAGEVVNTTLNELVEIHSVVSGIEGNANSINNATFHNAVADALLDRASGVETGLTFRQWLRLAAAALFGKTTNSQTKFRDFADGKDRLTATISSGGDRTAITRDAT